MIYIFEVRDDEMCSLPCKEFSKFADAFDYAQDGLTTRIFQVPVEDGCEPCYDDSKCIWDWSTPEDKATLVRLFDGCSPQPVCESVATNSFDDFDTKVQPEEFPEFRDYEERDKITLADLEDDELDALEEEYLSEGKLGDFLAKAASKAGQVAQKVSTVKNNIKTDVKNAKDAFAQGKDAEKYKKFDKYFKPETLTSFISASIDGKEPTGEDFSYANKNFMDAVKDFTAKVTAAGNNLSSAVLRADGKDNKTYNLLSKLKKDSTIVNWFDDACNKVAKALAATTPSSQEEVDAQVKKEQEEAAAKNASTQVSFEKSEETASKEETTTEEPVNNGQEQANTASAHNQGQANQNQGGQAQNGSSTGRKGDVMNAKIQNNKKIVDALKAIGVDVDALGLMTKKKDKKGRDYLVQTDKLQNLRKALFGESFESENIDEDDFDL